MREPLQNFPPSWDEVAAQYLELYERLVKARVNKSGGI